MDGHRLMGGYQDAEGNPAGKAQQVVVQIPVNTGLVRSLRYPYLEGMVGVCVVVCGKQVTFFVTSEAVLCQFLFCLVEFGCEVGSRFFGPCEVDLGFSGSFGCKRFEAFYSFYGLHQRLAFHAEAESCNQIVLYHTLISFLA